MENILKGFGDGGGNAADQSKTQKDTVSEFFEDVNTKVSKFLSFRKMCSNIEKIVEQIPAKWSRSDGDLWNLVARLPSKKETNYRSEKTTYAEFHIPQEVTHWENLSKSYQKTEVFKLFSTGTGCFANKNSQQVKSYTIQQ